MSVRRTSRKNAITKSHKTKQYCGQINDTQHGDELLSKTTVPASQETMKRYGPQADKIRDANY
jgi:hypothetical protein